MVQDLDVTLDAHQVDKIVMLLQCHSEMLDCQAMVSKILAELGKSMDPVTFRLILQTVIWSIHHINIPDSQMPAPKKTKKAKLMRETKLIHHITPNPNLMKDWVDDSVTLYLATTLYNWFEKIIMKSSNMKQVVSQFRVWLMGLCRCINGRIYEGGSAAQKWRSGTSSDTTPKKVPKQQTGKK